MDIEDEEKCMVARIWSGEKYSHVLPNQHDLAFFEHYTNICAEHQALSAERCLSVSILGIYNTC